MPSLDPDRFRHALPGALDNAGIGSWEWEPATDTVRCNHSMALYLGADVATLDITATTAWAAILPADLPILRSRIDQAIRDAVPFSVDLQVRPGAAPIRRLRVSGMPVHDRDGVATHVLGTAVDLTQRIPAVPETDHLQHDFLTTMSHELRTPLNAVLGWTQILRIKYKDGGDELRRGLEAIERNARLQTQLIDDLLDTSRILSGEATLDLQRMQPLDAVQAAIEAVAPAAMAKGVHLERAFGIDDTSIVADARRLQQIATKLLSNAIRFTPADGTVRVALQRTPAELLLTVTDSGAGMPPEAIAPLFDHFAHGDASGKQGRGRLGLGLPIIRELVVMHGGTIDAASPGPGQGTTMSVRLPLQPG